MRSDKKKKKLHNDACTEERKLLGKLLQSLNTKELSDFEETKGDDAWLCYNCQSELNRLEKLRNTVENLEKRLCDLANNLISVRQQSHDAFARKRPPASAASSPKAFRSQIEDVSAQLSGQLQSTESPPVAVS